MGLFKDAIKKGLSDAVDKAVTKGVQTIVAPAVAKVTEAAANNVAGHINEAATSINQANEALQQAEVKAEQATSETTTSTNEALSKLFSSYNASASSFMTNLSTNFKLCPKCGSAAPKDMEFCPECGAKLPEETISADYTCPDCGTVNLPETKFCVKCGAKLKGTIANEEKFAEDWEKHLAAYPKWTQGGVDLEIEEDDYCNGDINFSFTADKVTQEALDRYYEVLKKEGFSLNKDYRYQKIVADKCYTVAAEVEDNYLRAYFTESAAPKETPKPQQATLKDALGDTSEAISKGAEEAKKAFKAVSGLFKK